MADMEIRRMEQEGTDETGVVAISGRMTIEHAGEIRSALLEVFASSDGVRLDLERVSEVDLTGLQLICAAHISSIRLKKRFNVNTTASEPLISFVQNAGFLRHIGCCMDISQTCVWTGGENQWQR
ncbi:MAG TPA: STAS domain-containing protein [Geobacteraceae bacterium]